MTTETKICKVCNAEKPLTEYYTRKSRGKMVMLPSCKECMKVIDAKRKILSRDEYNKKKREKYQDPEYRKANNKIQRERRAADPEATRAKQRAYAAKNSETIAAQARAGYARNIEQRREEKRIYGEKNREVLRERNRTNYENHGDEYNARRREKWAINYEEYNQKQRQRRLDNPEAFKQYSKNKRDKRTEQVKRNIAEIRYFKNIAVSSVNRSKAKGETINPGICSKCGSTLNVVGHHDSYLKINHLNLRWLCQSCHKRFHVENKISTIKIIEDEVFGSLEIDEVVRDFINNACKDYCEIEIPETLLAEEEYVYNKVYDYLDNLNLDNIVSCSYGLLQNNVYGFNVIQHFPRYGILNN